MLKKLWCLLILLIIAIPFIWKVENGDPWINCKPHLSKWMLLLKQIDMKLYFVYINFSQQRINYMNFLLFSPDPGGGRLSFSPSSLRDCSLNEKILMRYQFKQEWRMVKDIDSNRNQAVYFICSTGFQLGWLLCY